MEPRSVDLSSFVFGQEDPRFTALDLPPGPTKVLRMSSLVVRARSMRRRTWTYGGEQHQVDAVDEFRDVFVPSEIVRSTGMLRFEPRFEELVADEPFDFLACEDLRPIAEETAYRGAKRQQTPDFCGHEFGDTIDLAIAALRGFFSWRGKEVGRDIRAFAWPFLWLQYDGRSPASIAVVTDQRGELKTIRAES